MLHNSDYSVGIFMKTDFLSHAFVAPHKKKTAPAVHRAATLTRLIKFQFQMKAFKMLPRLFNRSAASIEIV